jgi:phospholipid/cholesterol/gamma-HCH transport system permease protein
MSRFESELADVPVAVRGQSEAAPSSNDRADIDGGDHRGDYGLMNRTAGLAKVTGEIGGLFAMSLDVLVAMVRSRFAWREFLEQTWFAARVTTVPACMLVIPFFVLTNFVLNSLLMEIGAGDLSGAGASLTVVTQAGPWLTAIVIGGAAATAMCADLGARTIREEVDALKVMGIDPIQRLVVPRVVALTVAAELLSSVVSILGLSAAYSMSVFAEHVTPGAFASSLTLLVGVRDVLIDFFKVALFGAIGGFIGCYKGLTVSGGPDGVGRAVNETVVYAVFVAFIVNSLVTAVAAKGAVV